MKRNITYLRTTQHFTVNIVLYHWQQLGSNYSVGWSYLGGRTFAMVSWNLKSGSRVSGNSAENWASDRKLLAWGGRETKSICQKWHHNSISLIPVSFFLSTCIIISLRDLFVFSVRHNGSKVQTKMKEKLSLCFPPLRLTFLIFFHSSLFCLFCSIRSVVWPVKLLTETTVNALKATELPGRFVLLWNTHIYAVYTHTHTQSCNYACTLSKTTLF